MSHNPNTHRLFLRALNEIAGGGDYAETLTAQIRAALLALGSETPDNLNCASRIEIGNAGGKINPMLRDHRLSEIAHTLEDEPMPDRVCTAFPDLSDRDWEAFMRLTTLL